VHPAEYPPFPDDQGFSVSLATLTSVAIKQTRIERMPFPYDNTECGESSDERVRFRDLFLRLAS
jgi:hypothetical protein